MRFTINVNGTKIKFLKPTNLATFTGAIKLIL